MYRGRGDSTGDDMDAGTIARNDTHVNAIRKVQPQNILLQQATQGNGALSGCEINMFLNARCNPEYARACGDESQLGRGGRWHIKPRGGALPA